MTDKVDPDALLKEAQQGCQKSLGTLLEVYRSYLSLLARTQIDLHFAGQASCSDLVQETYLQACRHWKQFRGQSEKELVSWLRQILVNNLARLVEKQVLTQKRDVRREVSLTGLEQSSARMEAALVDVGSTPSAPIRRREQAALVAEYLAQLPESYRDVIILRNLEGLPFAEVALRMGRTVGAVRILWLRALESFRQSRESEGAS